MKVVKLEDLDRLLEEYGEFGFEDEKFSEFVERTKVDGCPIAFEV